MKQIVHLGWMLAFGATLHAQTINLHGRVSNASGQPVANAVVELVKQGSKTTTASDGNYSISKPSSSIRQSSESRAGIARLDRGILEFTLSQPSLVKMEVLDLNGTVRKREILPDAQPGNHRFDLTPSLLANQMLIVQTSIGSDVQTFHYSPLQRVGSRGRGLDPNAGSAKREMAGLAVAVDTLKVSAVGYSTKKIGLTSYDTTVNAILAPEQTGGVPKVTPSAVTTIPSNMSNPVANPGKLTKNVTYQAYWYSTSVSSDEAFRSVPSFRKQTTPKSKFFNVYTPPGYDPAIEYPYIIIMHGITDNPNTWDERANPKVNITFDNLITSKVTKPFIAVFASGTVDNNTNAYYAFGGELMNDLIPFIESRYSVKKDRGSRAMAGFSFGGMQTLTIGLCAHLKDFAWFGGLHPAGPPTPDATRIASCVAGQNPQAYPLHYLYIGRGTADQGAGASSANGLATKGPHITSANFSSQDNITGGGGGHNYGSAQVALFNFVKMVFSTDY